MRSRRLGWVTAAAATVLVWALTPIAATAHTADDPQCTDLIADGGSIATAVVAGDVCVWNDGTYLYVRYQTSGSWEMSATHLAVASSLDGIPQTSKGNPIPGQFPYSADYDPWVMDDTYMIELSSWPTGTGLYIAAHAVVWDTASQSEVSVVSDTSVDVTFPAAGPAVAANEPFNYPTCSAYTPDDANKSVWDTGIGTTAFNVFSAANADWIWNTLDPANPILGDIVVFERTLNLPGPPAPGGTLLITADNGYAAAVNGTALGSAQLGPGLTTTLKETVVGTPQTGDWGVASQGWQSVESWPLSGLVSGDNTLMIWAANEYMWNAGGYSGPDYYYGSWDPSGPPIYADPFPGTGIAGDNVCRNPAGLIFKLTASYYDRSETGWGAGPGFPGKNWATYFDYAVQAYVFGDTRANTPWGDVDLDFEVWGGPAAGTTSWVRATPYPNWWEGPVVSASIGANTASFTVRVASGTPSGIDSCDITIAVVEGGAGSGTWQITAVVNSPSETCPYVGQVQGPWTISAGSIDVFTP